MNKNYITLEELSSKYSWEEIGCVPGDGKFRRKLFTPFLSNLYENKIVYYERFMCVAILENVINTTERFEATAIPYITIERGERKPHPPTKPWKFGAVWSAMTVNDGHFSTYGGMWLFWTDKELVKTVEELAIKKDFETAQDITLYKGQQ